MSEEPNARRTIFAGFRSAALKLWGDAGLAQVSALLTPEARTATIDPVVIAEGFLPERYVLEWYEAVWAGPAKRDRTAYNEFLDRMLDHGFGKVRKVLLGIADAHTLARKAAELWRHDHSHGDLVVLLEQENRIDLGLRDHPYVDTPLARASIAEIIRYVVHLSRAKDVEVQHRLEGTRELVVQVDFR
ncbi:MAG: hypothetical protein HOW73_45525 [Polyangiaceae bacterium]|nr:hypothetical protein [Polyangiaceae bacterium]